MDQPKTLTLKKTQQLFDLNNNLINFKSSFSVTSQNKEPFYIVVTNQQTLDSGSPLEFKFADQGFASGDISQDQNQQNNWYLVLKSDKPNNVSIDIKTFPIPPQQMPPQQMPPQQMPPQQMLPQQMPPQQMPPQQMPPQQMPPQQMQNYFPPNTLARHQALSGKEPGKKNNLLKIIIIGALIGVGVYFLIKYIFLKKSDKSASTVKHSNREALVSEPMSTNDFVGEDVMRQIKNLPSF